MTVVMGHVLVAHSSYGVTNSPSALTVVMNSTVRVSTEINFYTDYIILYTNMSAKSHYG